jgi:hypothetical protein
LDPRVQASGTDMRAWLDAAHTIEKTECTLGRAVADLAALEQRVGEMERDPATKDAAAALRSALRPVALALRGDPNDPGHVNLPGRINWLTIQVGNYSGPPTAAQREWIATYAAQAADVVSALEKLKLR